MGHSLRELLEGDNGLGLGPSEKTAAAADPAAAAAAAAASVGADAPAINQLAQSLGLLDNEKTAAPAAAPAATEQPPAQTPAPAGPMAKVAAEGLDQLYSGLFPEDGGVGIPKTAEQEKLAMEEDLGVRAFDHFAHRFDQRIEKLAASVLSGDATISSPAAGSGAGETGNPHTDSQPPQASANNKPGNAAAPINTSPTVTNEIAAKNEPKTVGNFQQKHAAMDQALRKHLLLSQIEVPA